MGMSIEEEVKNIKEQLADVSTKYRMMQANYNARLKADLEAILVDLQLEIEELEPLCNECDYAIDDCTSKAKVNEVIQQKINDFEVEHDPTPQI